MIAKPPPFDPTALRVRADLRQLALDPARAGWHCVRRGVWLPPGAWEALPVDQQFEAFVFATLLSCQEPQDVIMCGPAAAAVWGMPSIDPWPRVVHVLDPDRQMGPSRYIRPRGGAPVQPREVKGALVTPPARTVIDLACTGSMENALAAADYALREKLCTRADLETEAAALAPGARGRSVCRVLVDLADGLSGSAGESLSRLVMFRANFSRPVLQREYRDELGLIGYVDFDLPGLIGEFDGKIKYKVPPTATPEDASTIVWEEKIREDRLRRIKPVARWTWSVARTPGALARLLISHGLRPLPRSTWFDLGERPAS